MFFDGWHDLGRILIVGTLAYVGLVFMLRVTGKRTLSKMNAFDLVVTVALGSTLATILLSDSVSLSEGMMAFALLCLLQYGVAQGSVYSNRFQSVIKAEPSLLYFRGSFLNAMLKRERVTEEEVLSAARSEGHADMGSVSAVVLETDGSFSVISGEAEAHVGTLTDVRPPNPAAAR
ncbi:DUF421 domain-containing protein [Aurantimonas sp. VKM B-3413]|uniref:DUF421 domain-containing protein n=1 Tax=Aurantimonas sp. VKM B-3413 TaxID=2779401 RepID=UPI001E3CF4A1|nr:YetF domain-containing protein [Aurantimonas sp. VKM B-3413]MCB8836646.1 DUF421 domain-containing protein [Aurantimonas sp. VKM B-3413]